MKKNAKITVRWRTGGVRACAYRSTSKPAARVAARVSTASAIVVRVNMRWS